MYLKMFGRVEITLCDRFFPIVGQYDLTVITPCAFCGRAVRLVEAGDTPGNPFDDLFGQVTGCAD